MGLSLSHASLACAPAPRPDWEACSASSSNLAESMLLAQSSSKDLDVMGVEMDTLSEFVSSPVQHMRSWLTL